MGNTSIQIAGVADRHIDVLFETRSRLPLEALPGFPAIPAYVASVNADLLPPLLTELERVTGHPPLLIGRDLQVPLRHAYETPATLGQDRLLAALAANREFPEGAIVLDAGSALTVDWVDDTGLFRGGAIAPGPAALMGTLKEAAAGLEWGGLNPEACWPGVTSAESCTAGLTATLRGQVRELLRWAREEAGSSPPLVLTGGAAATLAALVPEAAFVRRPHLVLEGIAIAASVGHE